MAEDSNQQGQKKITNPYKKGIHRGARHEPFFRGRNDGQGQGQEGEGGAMAVAERMQEDARQQV